MKLKATPSTIALSVVLLLASASVVAASGTNPPLVGTYKTLTNTVLPGRATESMPCDSCDGVAGNLIMAESYDGTTLGTNWKVTCAQEAVPATLVYDGVVSGTGQRIYQSSYTGGQLWLSGAGAWGTGDPYYSGGLSSFTVVAVKQYAAGSLVGIVSNVNFSGSLDGYDQCFTLAISNAEYLGATPAAPPLPGPFPSIQGPSDCNLPAAHGSYWNVHDITFSILGRCVTGARKSTWGELKSTYR
jgi:hypothetical protein